MSLNQYASRRKCRQCGAIGEQVWIDIDPESNYHGLCTACALKAREMEKMAPEKRPEPRPLAIPPPDPESTALATERASASSQLAVLEKLTIQSLDHKRLFAAALADVQARYKKLDTREREITRPALDSIESARELFRGPKSAYKALEECIKAKLADYEVRCALEVEAATARAQELAAAGDAEGARDALVSAGEASDASLAATEGMSVRHPWTFDVINIQLLDPKYLLPNVSALKEEMRRQLAETPDEAPVVPGVKFYRSIQVAGSAKKK